jgi:PAS domain-containing protein
MSISQNDTLHHAQAQMIEACSGSVARNLKGSRSSRLFAGLSHHGLTAESVEDEAGIKTIMNEAEGRWNPGEDALRLVIDTTPALIHTGRPDGYLEYFNQRWLEFMGLPLEELRPTCAGASWARDQISKLADRCQVPRREDKYHAGETLFVVSSRKTLLGNS